jgi:hypothetical protein
MNILRRVEIEGGEVRIDGLVDFRHEDPGHKRFLKGIYKHYGIDYPKFYKMSPLSKLGFLASELLVREAGLSGTGPERVAVIIANASSSLHTDSEYQKTVDSTPSPAVFVYTLPNILIGEVCIRNGFKGEGIFFVLEQYDRAFIFDYAELILMSGQSEISLAGWVDINENDDYLADLFLLRL